MPAKQITRDSKCPLCGGGMTEQARYIKDGGMYSTRRVEMQKCDSDDCGLPVRLWEEVERLKDCEPDVNTYEREIADIRTLYDEAVEACRAAEYVLNVKSGAGHVVWTNLRAVIAHHDAAERKGAADADE